MSEKLQKVLARAGHGSRREMEAWIAAGRVSIDGEIAGLGDRIEADAKIRIDGRAISLKSAEDVICRVLAYHKPEGEICSRKDPEGRPTVFDRLPKVRDSRWVAVGRLDINTSGLLLFTSDGELANRLMHPSNEVDREYAVRTFGEIPEATVQRLRTGVMLEDGPAQFDSIKPAGGEGMNQWWHVCLREGRNREVRRLWESQEVQVSRLIRIRYGMVELPKSLPRGGWVELPMEQVNYLRKLAGLEPETRTMLAADKHSVARAQVKSAKIRRAVRKHKVTGTGQPKPTRQRS
ncbi:MULTISPECIES: 23S rRNA pseudouridine(2605) synthase RluB [Shewanella]|uniref:Pseudouridine synthase n=2 Tax=Shewanella TaxID=22 RepID=A0A1N6YEB0_9GAMM|nr:MULTISPECIES: 23S rRNA pseudouridine(2605) synthase RluB [Shewanella]MCL1086912.1 23S rRNA pseudouridine(2605) synthase RluB [Shewanella glacialipiscicola]MCU7994527.1 23S rRNA pseudouridine(2605) synthase RluB [Shewanella glacialipiscicola]MCU8025998.1 23S rRNA pseudouridine(2605) synthase RluB [Shewanella glacialipiscicola]PTA50619.1 23S rRNA pseudouridine(2605) synthase RluB [Shewanella morhuae]SIR12918.1 ribosomal large subunit pseudouridine synthase B [Shewanella morhuae]